MWSNAQKCVSGPSANRFLRKPTLPVNVDSHSLTVFAAMTTKCVVCVSGTIDFGPKRFGDGTLVSGSFGRESAVIDKIGGRPSPGSTGRRNSACPRRRDSTVRLGGGESRFFSPVSVHRFTRRFLFYLFFFVGHTRASWVRAKPTET